MDFLFDFTLSKKEPLSIQSRTLGLYTFSELAKHIQLLPYGRNSKKSDYSLVLSEQKGTCSTKHAFLAKIAIENNRHDILFFIGIYKMNNYNTPGIGNAIKKYNLEYIPEAHTYLKHNGNIYDFTNKESNNSTFESDLLFEKEIRPDQIGEYKTNFHKTYLKKWINETSIKMPLNKIWQIRESCIKNLSENS